MFSVKTFFFCVIPIVTIVLFPGHPGFPAPGASKHTVYFYNPESNVDNFASLKTRLDMYLNNLGPYQFQPFCDRKTFETHIRGKRDCVLILSSWYYKELKESFPMKPFLVGMVDGESIQKKILTSKNTITNLGKLKGVSIASAGSEEYTRNFLKLMLGKDNEWLVDTLQVLSVPKDIDALISVGFGLVQTALTTEYSISRLSSVNQGLYKKLLVLAKNENSLLPIVAIPEGCDPETLRLLKVVEGMGKTTEGKNCIRMFGLDDWKVLDERDRELLRK